MGALVKYTHRLGSNQERCLREVERGGAVYHTNGLSYAQATAIEERLIDMGLIERVSRTRCSYRSSDQHRASACGVRPDAAPDPRRASRPCDATSRRNRARSGCAGRRRPGKPRFRAPPPQPPLTCSGSADSSGSVSPAAQRPATCRFASSSSARLAISVLGVLLGSSPPFDRSGLPGHTP